MDALTQHAFCIRKSHAGLRSPLIAALSERSMNPLSLVVIPYNRIKHIVGERQRLKQLERTIETIRAQHAAAGQRGLKEFQRIHNVGLYLLIFEYDMAILRNDALFSVRKWKKSFVARQMAVTLYEASHDIPHLLGKEFRANLKAIDIGEHEWAQFNSLNKEFHAFGSTHRKMLKELRNYVGAHRDNDAALQLSIIEDVDLLEVMELAGDLYTVIRRFLPFLIAVTNRMSNLQVVLKNARFDEAVT